MGNSEENIAIQDSHKHHMRKRTSNSRGYSSAHPERRTHQLVVAMGAGGRVVIIRGSRDGGCRVQPRYQGLQQRRDAAAARPGSLQQQGVGASLAQDGRGVGAALLDQAGRQLHAVVDTLTNKRFD